MAQKWVRIPENNYLVPTTVASLNLLGNFLNFQLTPMWEGGGVSTSPSNAEGSRSGESWGQASPVGALHTSSRFILTSP